MKRLAALALLVLLVLLALAAAVLPAQADMGGFHIASFHAELEVQQNAELLVTERIEVQFQGPRHGIYRTIPVRYTDPRGYSYSLGFQFLGVADENGKSYRAKVTNKGQYVKIRIGSPDFKVDSRQVYVLRYRARRALVHFPEHDELYWNVTGTEWNERIDTASATVRLPGDPGSEDLRADAWAGPYGSRKQDTGTRRSEPGVMNYNAVNPLQPGEGLTVALAWPHGLVDFPGPAFRAAQLVLDNWIVLVPLLLLAVLWRLYRSKGRDPEGPAAVTVRYEPPEGITPAELGTLVDETVHLRDITATVVDLAVRGFLMIHEEKKKHLFGLIEDSEISFERLSGESEDSLRQHEKEVLHALFASGNHVQLDDLKEKFYKRIPIIKNALYDHLVEGKFFAAKPSTVRRFYGVMGVLAGGVTFGVGFGWAVFRGGILPFAAFPAAFAGIASLVLFLIFARAMPRRTREGVGARNWGLGFEEFVERVEGDRVDADDARQVFERLLPYAMALGIATSWARRFEGIYRARDAPAWYGGHHITNFSTLDFENSLSSAMTKAGGAMTAAPRSQGSSGFSGGGGGFSGGGGGGGGGGSW